jgi:hypothetical protein
MELGQSTALGSDWETIKVLDGHNVCGCRHFIIKVPQQRRGKIMGGQHVAIGEGKVAETRWNLM